MKIISVNNPIKNEIYKMISIFAFSYEPCILGHPVIYTVGISWYGLKLSTANQLHFSMKGARAIIHTGYFNV